MNWAPAGPASTSVRGDELMSRADTTIINTTPQVADLRISASQWCRSCVMPPENPHFELAEQLQVSWGSQFSAAGSVVYVSPGTLIVRHAPSRKQMPPVNTRVGVRSRLLRDVSFGHVASYGTHRRVVIALVSWPIRRYPRVVTCFAARVRGGGGGGGGGAGGGGGGRGGARRQRAARGAGARRRERAARGAAGGTSGAG